MTGICIKNAQIISMSDYDFECGNILVSNGKIVEISVDITADMAGAEEFFDAEGRFVMPGLIDAHTHVGICEEVYSQAGEDTNEETDPITPHMRALDAINHEDLAFRDAALSGVTTISVSPGSASVLCGEIAVLKTVGETVDKMLLKEPAAMKAAFGENPKSVYAEQKKMPMTRMATAALLRETLVKVVNYERKDDCERDLRLESLLGVLNGRLPLHAHAHRADDIMTAARIANEFGLDLVVVHGTDGHKVAGILAERNIPVISGPLLTSRAKVEMKDVGFDSPGIMSRAGVTVALCTDHPVIPIRYLMLCASLAYRAGMCAKDALAAVTINPARILGVEDYVGSIEPGKDADLVVFDQYPLNMDARVERVMINGIWHK